MGFPKTSTAWEAAEVIGGINCDRPCILVLDNFQFIQQKLPSSLISALLSYSGLNLHIIIVTQTVRPYERSFFKQHGVYYIDTEDLRLQISDIKSYFRLCGETISKSDAGKLYHYTEGWIAALYLIMLQIKRGEGFEPGHDIIRLMDSIVWGNIPNCHKNMILYSAIFTHISLEQMQFFRREGEPQVDVLDILDEIPFIRYDTNKGLYALHFILRKALLRRLEAADNYIKTLCYSRAGDWLAKIGQAEGAFHCYYKANNHESALSLPLSKLTLMRVEGLPFTEPASRLLADCPPEIMRRHPITLLRIAYAFIGANQLEKADSLLKELKRIIEELEDEDERRLLRGEWLLVSAFRRYPNILEMEFMLKEAVSKIGGRCRTITQGEPFAFGLPLMIFFLGRPGKMEEESEALTRTIEYLTDLTGVYSGADVLLKAECAIYKGNLDKAEPLCHQAFYLSDSAGQWAVKAGAINQLAQIAFKRGNIKDLNHYIKELAKSIGDDAMAPWVSQMLQADYYSWMGLTKLTAPWINKGEIPFPDAPGWTRTYLRYAHLAALIQGKEYTRFLGAAEAALIECHNNEHLVMRIYIHLLLALGYLKMGEGEQALNHTIKALSYALPDQIYLPFMEFKWMLDDLIEKAFASLDIKMPEEIVIKGRMVEGSQKLLMSTASADNTLPYDLTRREMDVAGMASKGMSNKEIARKLHISETTVKFHLRTVFSKMGIDRRTKLPGLLSD